MHCMEVRITASIFFSAMILRRPARRASYSNWVKGRGDFSPFSNVKNLVFLKDVTWSIFVSFDRRRLETPATCPAYRTGLRSAQRAWGDAIALIAK